VTVTDRPKTRFHRLALAAQPPALRRRGTPPESEKSSRHKGTSVKRPTRRLEPHPVDQDALALRDPGCLGLRDLCNVLEGRHRELVAQVANVQCVTARVLLQVRRQEQSRIVEGRDLEGR